MFIPQILETKIYAKPLEVEQDCSAVSWTFLQTQNQAKALNLRKLH